MDANDELAEAERRYELLAETFEAAPYLRANLNPALERAKAEIVRLRAAGPPKSSEVGRYGGCVRCLPLSEVGAEGGLLMPSTIETWIAVTAETSRRGWGVHTDDTGCVWIKRHQPDEWIAGRQR